MSDHDDLATELLRIVAEDGAEAPLRICQAVVAVMPLDGAAITLISDPDHQEPVCATDELAARLDELQFTLAEGPCVDAHATGHPVLVADIADPADMRWPAFVDGVRATRMRAIFAVPMQIGAARLGVLDLYRLRQGHLSRDDLTSALQAADAAMWAVLDPRARPALEDAERAGEVMQAPLAWAEVHQATGMLIAQLGISAAAALARLRAYAFAHERRLNDVARDVVARRLRLNHDDDAHGD